MQVINNYLLNDPLLFLFHNNLFNSISSKLNFYVITYIKYTFTPLIYFIYPVTKKYYHKLPEKIKIITLFF